MSIPFSFAYRTSGLFGQPGPAAGNADPAAYLVPTNNNYDKDGTTRDYDLPTVLAGSDRDLAKIVLHGPDLSAGVPDGRLSITLSNPASANLFKDNGDPLTPADLTLDLTNPGSGYLAGLMTGNVTVWLQGLEADPDLTLKYAYTNSTTGHETARATVHMAIVDLSFMDAGGSTILSTPAVSAPALTAQAGGRPGLAGTSYGSFLPKIAGLPTALGAQVAVSDGTASVPAPFNTGAAITGGEAWLALADAALTSDEQAKVRSVLGVNPLQPGQTSFTLTTPFDSLTRAFAAGPSLIAVDGNRNGTVTLDGQDRTSSVKPYRFWLNDDNDVANPISEQSSSVPDQWDVLPSNPAFSADSTSIFIKNTRDLEDWSPITIQAPPGYAANASWKVQFALTGGEAEGMGIKFTYVTAQQAAGYLTDGTIASQLVGANVLLGVGAGLGSATSDADILNSAFASYQQGGVAHLLFEGIHPGNGALVVQFLRDGVVVATDAVHLDLRPVKQFYEHWTVDDTDTWGNLRDPGTPRIPLNPYLTSDSGSTFDRAAYTDDYVLFVHGWNMTPADRRNFAATTYKRLFWQGFQGRFGMYSWPTGSGVDGLWDLSSADARWNFDSSELRAYASAAGLRTLLKSLGAAGYSVNLFAHSLGNAVASEALRQEAVSPNPQKIVHTYVASQAATTASAYDNTVPKDLHSTYAPLLGLPSNTPDIYSNFPTTGRAYFRDIGLASEKSYNFFNPNDGAVATWYIWPLNQALKPDNDPFQNVRYGYDGTSFYEQRGAYVGTTWVPQTTTVLRLGFAFDAYAAFSFAAEAKSKGLGATSGVGFPFSTLGEVNLQQTLPTAFQFNDSGYDHSGQFHHDGMTTQYYWNLLMKSIGFTVGNGLWSDLQVGVAGRV